MARDIGQVPQYKGTERRIVIIDHRFSFYGADLVQNDPWLRGNEIRMYSHGAAADEQMMARYYSELHRVYTDRYGTVWSQASQSSGAPDASRRQDPQAKPLSSNRAPTLSTNEPRQRCKMPLAAYEDHRGSNMKADT